MSELQRLEILLREHLDRLMYGDPIDTSTLTDEELADAMLGMIEEKKSSQLRERTRLLRPRLRRLPFKRDTT